MASLGKKSNAKPAVNFRRSGEARSQRSRLDTDAEFRLFFQELSGKKDDCWAVDPKDPDAIALLP